MQITSIELRNFRNFKHCDIEFSTDKDRNVTVILGQNTYGKTTIVKAFIWCLYRENKFKDGSKILNDDVADNMMPNRLEKVSVTVRLYHNGYSYAITTKQEFFKNASGRISENTKAKTIIYKSKGSVSRSIDAEYQVKDEIDSILPQDFKDYFFFEGESNSIEAVSKKPKLAEAVTNILGLKKYEGIKEYYDSTKKESVPAFLEKEKKHVDILDSSSVQAELDRKKEKLQRTKEEIANAKNEIEGIEIEIQNLNEKIEANQSILDDQQRRNVLVGDIARAKSDEKKDFDSACDFFSRGDTSMFLRCLFASAYKKFDLGKKLSESTFTSENSYTGINEAAVDELIKSGYCICGTPITDKSAAYDHLIEAKRHMEPHDFGKYTYDFKQIQEETLELSRGYWNDTKDHAQRVKELIVDIEEKEDELKSLEKSIAGQPDVGQLYHEKGRLEGQLSEKKWYITNSLDKIQDMVVDIKQAENRLKMSEEKNDYNDYIDECLHYCDVLYSWACKKITTGQISIRNELQKEVGDIFKKMYHGDRRIVIDERLNAKAVVDSVGKKEKDIDASTGLGTVVNYAFVAGLSSLAKRHILEEDIDDDDESSIKLDDTLEDEVFPLVMDAPFSNTDEKHIINICKVLPNYCDQVIMIVMEKDFNYARNVLADRIGKEYVLKKISETEAEIEERGV